MSKQTTRVLLLSLAPLGILIGCHHEAAVEKATNKLVPVKTVAVVQQDVQRTTTQPATVHPFYRTEMRAKVSGYVQAVQSDIGDYVEKGQVLAIIAVPEMQKRREILQARIAQYQAQEKQAEAGVELAQATIESAEARLTQARSEMSRAEAALAAIEAEFNRTEDLVERRSLESRVLDEVRKQRDSERANQKAVASAIDSAQAEVTVAQAKLRSAQADLQAAMAETVVAERQLDELDVLLDYATLKAPFTGLVTQRSVDLGDLVRERSEVGPGEPLFVLSQVDKVRVHIPVPEADAAWVSPGDLVRLRFPSFPAEAPIEASVTRLSGDLDPNTRTMLVEVEVPNPERKLLPGMFGEATILLDTNVASNILPARAVRFDDQGNAYVYVVDDQQTVTVTPITTGRDDGHSIEVTAGISAGQAVIDAHLKRFVTGQKVTLLQQ